MHNNYVGDKFHSLVHDIIAEWETRQHNRAAWAPRMYKLKHGPECHMEDIGTVMIEARGPKARGLLS